MTGSVSGGAIAVMILNVIICFGIPLGLMVWLVLKKKATMRPVLTGMLVFFVFQMLLRIPLMRRRNLLLLVLAIALHTLVDAPAVILASFWP